MIKKLFSKKTPVEEAPSVEAGTDSLSANAFEQALEQHQRGNLEQAEALYRQILQQNPHHADALHFLGVLAYQVGQPEAAVELISKAIAIDVTSPSAYCNLGLALQTLGKLDSAIENYQKAILLQPDYSEAFNNLANVLFSQNKLDAAADNYFNALALKPDYVDARYNLAGLLAMQNKIQAAIENYRYVLILNPNHSQAQQHLTWLSSQFAANTKLNDEGSHFSQALRYYQLGKDEQSQRHLKQAVEQYKKALAIKLDYHDVYHQLGMTYQMLYQMEQAVQCFRFALLLKADDELAYYNLGNIFFALGQLPQAVENYQKALTFKPDYVNAYYRLFITKLYCCDWSDYFINIKRICHWFEEGQYGDKPFQFLAMSSSLVLQQQYARSFVANRYPAAKTALWTKERYQHEKIRLAYLSDDFREHATAYLIAGLLELHDKNRFELIAVSLSPVEKTETGQRVVNCFSRFIDVSEMGDKQAAQLIRSLEIDILVDLMGLTSYSRIGILAYRPAPIQVNYLGYPGTMGADYIDYILADRYVIPKAHQPYYTEKVVYLPDSYQANDFSRKIAEVVPSRAELGLPENAFVFCCFNNNYKITPDIFEIWMRLLTQTPDSVLWLLEDNSWAADNLKKTAQSYGITVERLIFAPRVKVETHLARQKQADLFLDTLPYNAHTTASDALWVGLPVVTCAGEAFAGCVAESLLHAIGLPELITNNLADYEALALKLVTTPELLAKVRSKLAANRTTQPLFNTDRFRKHIEAAYITMWERYQRGESPMSFAVPTIE